MDFEAIGQLTFALLLIIPVFANALLRSKLHAFLLSAPVGVCVLWIGMVSAEANAADSDFDLIFAVACVIWAAIVVSGYALISALFALGAILARPKQ